MSRSTVAHDAIRPVAQVRMSSRVAISIRAGRPNTCQAWSPPANSDGIHRAAVTEQVNRANTPAAQPWRNSSPNRQPLLKPYTSQRVRNNRGGQRFTRRSLWNT